MKKYYVPPKQGWLGQVFDSIFILALVFASLLTPLLLKSEGTVEEAVAKATTTWESLNLSAVEQVQWIKLGYDAEEAGALINNRFDYTVDPLWLVITIVVIAGYFIFMLRISDKEYKEIINEKFGEQ
jgi:hypothetical protein